MATIKTVKHWHDGMIDIIIANPQIGITDLAKATGYTIAWMSQVVNSPAFKERLAERKAEIVDPILAASTKDRLEVVANRALDRIIAKLDGASHMAIKDRDLIEMAKLGASGIGALGGSAHGNSGPVQNLYVINSPAPAKTSTAWVEQVAARQLARDGAAPALANLPPAEILPGDRNA